MQRGSILIMSWKGANCIKADYGNVSIRNTAEVALEGTILFPLQVESCLKLTHFQSS